MNIFPAPMHLTDYLRTSRRFIYGLCGFIAIFLITSCGFMTVAPAEAPANTPVYISSATPSGSQVFDSELESGSYIGVGRAVSHTYGPVPTGGSFSTGGTVSESYLEKVRPTGILSTNLGALISTLRPEYRRAEAELTSPHFEVLPAVILLPAVRADQPAEFTVSCVLYASLVNGSNRWKSRYLLNERRRFKTASPTVKDDFQAHIADCFKRTTELFALHISNPPGMIGEAFIGPNTSKRKVIVPLLPQRIVLVDHLGFYELDRETVRTSKVVLQ
ncbi:MAG: hypothetical protein V4607_14535 [Pseudomonadota bacterium]